MVRVTQVYERHRQLIHTVSLLIVEGTVQQQDGVINVLAGQVVALAPAGGAPAGLPGL
jgi:hypothetical protein